MYHTYSHPSSPFSKCELEEIFKEKTMKTIKIWFGRIVRSKTMMFNALVAALLALEATFGLLQPHIAGSVFAWTSVILAAGNAVLRTVTNKPLRSK